MSNGRIPEEVIEAVLKHHDIVDVVGRYVHLSKQGHYMKGLCPFHSEKTPSFTVTPEKQIFHCFGCNTGGNSIIFIKEMESLSFVEAVSMMAEEANIPISWEAPKEEQSQHQAEMSALFQAYELSAKWYHYILRNTEQGKEAMNYLRSRGLTDKWIDFFQIGYAPPSRDTLAQFLEKRLHELPLMEKGGLLSTRAGSTGYVDKFRDRVLFPICDMKGRVIAFGGRAMGDVQPKYMNSPESMLFNKSSNLYNFHHARPAIRSQRQAVLFEGYVDVIKAWEAGVVNSVATMGTALTEAHAERLRRNVDQVIVCYDGDNAGQTAAFKSIAILEKTRLQVKLAMLPNAMDPDEYITTFGAEKFQRDIIESAVPPIQYKLLYERKKYNLQEADGRLRYLNMATRLIAEISSPVEREHYVKELSVDFQYSIDSLKQQMNESRQDFLKKQQTGDNKDNSWNNEINTGKKPVKAVPLQHSYYNAETKLLAVMMHDSEICELVRQKLGDKFNVEAHAALAANLYAYYAHSNQPDVSRFISTLQDERLESAASSILTPETNKGINSQVIDAYIHEIMKYPQQKELNRQIELKKQEIIQAQNVGNIDLAVQVGKEKMALEKQLKSL